MILSRRAHLHRHSERSVSGFLLPADCAFGNLRSRREVEESLGGINQGNSNRQPAPSAAYTRAGHIP